MKCPFFNLTLHLAFRYAQAQYRALPVGEELTLQDHIIPAESGVHIAASAFYNCLGACYSPTILDLPSQLADDSGGMTISSHFNSKVP